MPHKLKNYDKITHLFGNWPETMIWSCLQNVMGHIFANDPNEPDAVMAVLGDFCFMAGMPDKELVSCMPKYCEKDFIIMVPQNDAWSALIEECQKEHAKKVERYAIKKEKDNFDKEFLQTVVAGLSNEYQLKMIDEALFYRCREEAWCKDWVALYDDYAHYKKYGLGAVILKDGEIVSGASSYSSYNGGIEVEIDTRQDHRRKGLAYAAGAKLISECLERGLYPSWDAQNKWSVALAEKLGYHYSHTYTAYEIYG